MIRRLVLVWFWVALAGATLEANAQKGDKVHSVGFIATTSPVTELLTSNPAARGFAQGMRELGYTEGKNLVIEWRSAEGRFERFPGIVRELVSRNVDVIVTVTNAMTKAAMGVTQTVPIVMGASNNPVEQKLVASLSRPGGNVTGFTLDVGPEIVGKRLQILKAIVPSAVVVAFLGAKFEGVDERTSVLAAQQLGMRLLFVDRSPAEYDEALAFIAHERPHALLVAATAPNYAYRRRIADFAAKNRLPAIYPGRDYAAAGGLVSYGLNTSEHFRLSAAGYVDKILKGASPADLPVERPSKLELVVNVKTAKGLGLSVAPSLLLQADVLIE